MSGLKNSISVRIYRVCVAALYTSLLIVVYSLEVSMVWEYMGFRTIESYKTVPLLLLLICSFVAVLPTHETSRTVLLTVVYFVFLIPSLIFHLLVLEDVISTTIVLISVALVHFFSLVPFRPAKLLNFRSSQFQHMMNLVLIALVLLYPLYSGVLDINFDFSKIYDFRKSAGEVSSGFSGYIVFVCSSILLPFALVYAIQLRRYAIIFALCFLMILFFGMTNFKGILFGPLVVLAVFYCLNRFGLNGLTLAFVAIPLTSICIYYFNLLIFDIPKTSFVTDNFVRRSLFVPPMLDHAHIVFFSENAPYYWSTSRFGLGLVENTYGLTSPFVVGEYLFGSNTWAANTGFVGSGFANARYVGVLVYSVVFGLIISYVSAYGRTLGHNIVSATSFLSILTISRSSDLTTVILTHGLVFLLLLYLFSPAYRGRATRDRPADVDNI